MIDALIERLKERAPNVCDPACRGRCPACPMELMLDAAAELSRLRQSEAELREVLEMWVYRGQLQTFEDRERFRAAARAALRKETKK